jgi:low temperature requirement protein LtrA
MIPALKPFRNVDLRSRVSGRLRAVSWLELFFDLVFVAGISQIGIPFAANYTPLGLLRYAFMFLLIWWAWLGHTMFSTRFESDDLAHRILTLVQIFAVAVMAANARAPLSGRDSAGFVAAYAVMRLILSFQYLRARAILETRTFTTIYAFGFGGAALLWLVSALTPTPMRFWIWGIALVTDLSTPWIASPHTRRLPPDTTHLPERFGLFTIILLGESVSAVMRGVESQESWTPSAAAAALLSLTLVFGYWWWYFEAAGAAEERRIDTHRRATALRYWSYAHFPLYLGIAATGVGSQHVISMATSTHLSQTGTLMILGSAAALMFALVVVTLCSGRNPCGLPAQLRLRWQILVVLFGLGGIAFGTKAAPYVVEAWLVLLCGTQILLTLLCYQTESSCLMEEPVNRQLKQHADTISS